MAYRRRDRHMATKILSFPAFPCCDFDGDSLDLSPNNKSTMESNRQKEGAQKSTRNRDQRRGGEGEILQEILRAILGEILREILREIPQVASRQLCKLIDRFPPSDRRSSHDRMFDVYVAESSLMIAASELLFDSREAQAHLTSLQSFHGYGGSSSSCGFSSGLWRPSCEAQV
jgi:hypothetical protein